MTVELPKATRQRFQPLRSGLVNLYRYDDQEFWFEDGHLILRGNNGTGKSRVLALQLPFLFDGEVASHRMEPDGDPAKRVEWNLLLGGRHADRLGYTWLELGRLAPELPAGADYVTIGCGLSAAAGRGLVGRWFFVTRQRVGHDLFLVAPNGQPLSRERLGQAIGTEGEVHHTAAAYREAVDKALFGLGKVRYEALINLLIQLRQPQLSRQLDEPRLSKALSEALAPPAPRMVADVAEAFRALETDRDALDAFRTASRAVEQFLVEYRRYAQIAARRRAAAVRRRHSVYEEAMRTLRDAERALTDAEVLERELAARIETARIEEQAAAARTETLAASPAMQDAQALRRAREAADSAAVDVSRGVREADHRNEIEARRSRELADATAATAAASAGLSALRDRSCEAAATVGIERRHNEIVGRLDLQDQGPAETAPETLAPPSPDDGIRADLQDLLAERRRALKQMRFLAEELRRALAVLEQAEASARALEGDVDEAAQAQVAAVAGLEGETHDLIAAYGAWAAATRALSPPPAAELVASLTAWVTDPGGPTGPSPLMSAVTVSLAAALQRMSGTEAAAKARLEFAVTSLAALRAERDRVAGGEHRPPQVPFTRNEATRQERSGAPLWRLVDFMDEVSGDQRAGLEAALEAAGILDAWVTPDGRLLGPDEHDVLLIAVGSTLENAGEPHLGTVLRPAIDRTDPRTEKIADDTVLMLLERIALGVSTFAAAAVDFDGRFRLGPLDGRWAKAAAEHIGEGARRMAQKRRLDELASLIAAVAAEKLVATEALNVVRADIAAAQAEAAAGPDDRAVRIAAANLEGRSRSLAQLRARLADAERRAIDARELSTSRRGVRDQAAADLSLERFVEDLPALEEALAHYGAEIAAFAPSLVHHRATAARARDAAGRFQNAQAEAATATALLVELRGRAAALTAARDALEESVGAAADDILTRYAEAQGALKKIRSTITDLDGLERGAHDRTVLGRAAVSRADADLGSSDAARASAVASLARLAEARMLGVATPDFAGENAATWSVTRAVDVAREIESRLERVDASDAAWDRTGRGLLAHIETLRNALLPHGHQATTSIEDDLVVVSVPFQGRHHTMTESGRSFRPRLRAGRRSCRRESAKS
jgi:uncharacterized protein (TIGR02680 family)